MDLLCLYWGRFGDSTSNIVESMNSSLLKIRKRPVYGVVTGLLAFQSEKSHKEMTCGFEDFAVNRLAEHQVESLNFAVVDTDEFIKLVRTPDGQVFTVNLMDRTCHCGYFQQCACRCVNKTQY